MQKSLVKSLSVCLAARQRWIDLYGTNDELSEVSGTDIFLLTLLGLTGTASRIFIEDQELRSRLSNVVPHDCVTFESLKSPEPGVDDAYLFSKDDDVSAEGAHRNAYGERIAIFYGIGGKWKTFPSLFARPDAKVLAFSGQSPSLWKSTLFAYAQGDASTKINKFLDILGTLLSEQSLDPFELYEQLQQSRTTVTTAGETSDMSAKSQRIVELEEEVQDLRQFSSVLQDRLLSINKNVVEN